MDVTLVRTFLVVATSRSFVAAADILHVTQSAVSVRIRRLENLLGQTLFERSKAGVKLTHAGDQFEPMARNFMQLWDETRFNVSLPERYQDSLALACEESLWPELSTVWLANAVRASPFTAYSFQVSTPDAINNLLIRGLVNIAVLYNPQVRAGFHVQEIMQDRLILVTGDPDSYDAPGDEYIFTDWGPEFLLAHSRWFPDMDKPQITMRIGTGIVKYLIKNRKSTYMPHRIADDYIADGQLFWVRDAPTLDFPAYAVCSNLTQSPAAELAMAELKKAGANAPWIDIADGAPPRASTPDDKP